MVTIWYAAVREEHGSGLVCFKKKLLFFGCQLDPGRSPSPYPHFLSLVSCKQRHEWYFHRKWNSYDEIFTESNSLRKSKVLDSMDTFKRQCAFENT